MLTRILSTVGVAIALSACTAITPVEEQYSGFLADYSNLEPVAMADGSEAMRWYSPAAKGRTYNKVMVQPITFFPKPEPNEQVSLENLHKLSDFMTQTLRSELGSHFDVVDQPGPNTLKLTFAITGVETPTEGLSAQNAIPVSLLVAGASVASGERDHVTVLYLEGQATDAQSGEILAKGVRQGVGSKLHDEEEQLTPDKLKGLIDSWSKEISQLAQQIK
jgi:hypothetical protein